jgi:ABC-type multidrug transport system fused ATPase/permease subunit
VLEVLASPEVVAEHPAALAAAPPRSGLAMRGVWFAYPDGPAVLRNLDLEVAAGS